MREFKALSKWIPVKQLPNIPHFHVIDECIVVNVYASLYKRFDRSSRHLLVDHHQGVNNFDGFLDLQIFADNVSFRVCGATA